MLAKLVERGRWQEASEELCERQYDMLCQTLRDAGYRHYEISNFALPGYEARHNSAYWRHIPYVGFGPGAHSYVIGSRTLNAPVVSSHKWATPAYQASETRTKYNRLWNEPDLNKYIEDPAGCQDGEELTQEQLVLERIMLSLRTAEGIQESYLREHCDRHELSRAFDSGNLVHLPDGNVRIPENRFFLSDKIISDII